MLSGRLARLYLDLDQRRNYTEAETLLQQALLFTTQDQPEHPHATSIYHDLGDLYLKQEKFVQAEEMYYQALSIDQKIFGNAHLVVASDLGQLATLNYEQNRFDEALSLRKEEMSILQKMWGEQHLDVAACFYLIGESHHLRALQILSLDKPDTISTDALGHFEEADKQYTKALEIAEVVGEKDTAELARDSLEALYQDRSNYFEES